MTSTKKKIQNLIAEARTEEALVQLRSFNYSDRDLRNQINLLSARFTKNKKQRLLGITDDRELNVELNKINAALLEVVEGLENATETWRSGNTPQTPTNPGFSWTKWTGLNDVKSWIALLAGLAAILTFYFKYCGHLPEGGNRKPFSVVVYTHGNGGKQDILQLKDTKLVADFHGRRDVAKVGENGQNTFNEVPALFHNKKIGIGIQGNEGYVLKYPDSTYLLNEEPIYLAVQSSCRFCLIEGFVQSQNKFIPNLIVSTGTFSDTTDSKGYFKINIPPHKEADDYPITISRNGIIVKRIFITPDPKQPAEILLDN